jgi:hypothetical protein
MANDKKGSDVNLNKADLKKANALDRAAERILRGVDPSYTDSKVMNEQDAEFQRIIDRQLDIAKGVAGNQIVDFIASIRNDKKKSVGRPRKDSGVDTSDLFTENVGDIFEYFQDVYKNRYMEVSDLKFISKFIPSIGEAVRIYLDAIVSSDDVSQTITRNLTLPDISQEGEEQTVLDAVKRMEEELRLLPKLKVAYKKALVSGTFYVYHISYAELFAQYSQGVASGRITKDGPTMMGNARTQQPREPEPGSLNPPQGKWPRPGKHNPLGVAEESALPITDIYSEPALEAFGSSALQFAQDGFIEKCNYGTRAMEACLTDIHEMASQAPHYPYNRDGTQYNGNLFADRLVQSIEADLPTIYFNNSNIPFDVLDAADGIAQEGYNDFFNLRKDVDEDTDRLSKTMGGVMSDGTMDVHRHYAQSFEGVSGTYLKWIDYKYMMPIEVLGQVVGYYHIITTPKQGRKKNRGQQGGKANEIGGILSSGSMSLFDQLDISEKRKEAAVQNIVDTISGCILDQFSARFVKKNAAFKQLIAECIIANGLVDNDYMIQFIPINNVIEFKCNEDENGHGESILSEAMFPAHLLLSIVVCKMLNYINKGGNKTIAHISSGKVTRTLTNQVNRVIRDLQASNVTFTDLLSSSMVFSKVTRDSNIAMPKDQQGNRLVEFEVQEGQDIQLDTQYETMLERWCMMATGMPPTVMDYESNVDVAKKVVSDNIRVAGRVASLQADFEEPTTQLYRALIRDSDLDDSLKTRAVNGLRFKLPRPRILANQNNSEALSTAYNNAQTIANIKLGENTQEEDDLNLKSKLTEKLVIRETPFIQWDEVEDMLNEARIEMQKEKVKKAAQSTEDNMENPDDAVEDLDTF